MGLTFCLLSSVDDKRKIHTFIFGIANFTGGNVNPEPIETVI